MIWVWLSDVQDKSFTKLLITVKSLIANIYAVRQLQSDNIEMSVSDQCTKNWMFNQSQVNNLQILQQNYSVKLWDVSLFTSIDSEKNTNNISLIQDICAAFKVITFTLNINKIHWLHTLKQHESCLLADKIKEIIVISLLMQTLQHKIIQKRLIINFQLYNTHFHNHDIQIQQCFNCDQWKYTQSVCEKTVKCSICINTH